MSLFLRYDNVLSRHEEIGHFKNTEIHFVHYNCRKKREIVLIGNLVIVFTE